MKNKNWRIIGGIAIILLFSARIYFSYQEKKDKEKQEEMFRELSRVQSQDFDKQYKKNLDSILTVSSSAIEEQQKVLDSIGKKMKADQEAFEKKMKE